MSLEATAASLPGSLAHPPGPENTPSPPAFDASLAATVAPGAGPGSALGATLSERRGGANAPALGDDDTIIETADQQTRTRALASAVTRSSRSSPPLSRGRGGLERGESIGRFVVLSELGAGGMGSVYAAYDPELDRKVAIKLLHDRAHTARLLREAQSLARLAHPNIVAVFDVGDQRGAVWVAMEYIDGQTFGDWLAGEGAALPWRERIDRVLEAARGVAAAHAAGIIHRDLKPDNVMIGKDGRVRVMDFGLARAGAEVTREEEQTAADSLTTSTTTQLDVELTSAGTVMGTPAYMAAEQFLGATTDERTDQFALCVILWETLYGERPFAGETFSVLKEAVSLGRMRSTPSARRVPAWLRRVLERGLSSNPEARWPSVPALLAAIDRGRARVRRRRVFIGSGLIGLVALGALGAQRLERSRAVAACDAAAAAITEVWPGGEDGRRATLREHLARSSLSYARETFSRVQPWLDRYVDDWRSTRAATCRAATVDDGLSDGLSSELARRADACLEERATQLETLLDALTRSGDAGVTRAVTAVASLPPATDCGDRSFLERQADPPPPQELARQQALRARLHQVVALSSAGDSKTALARVEALLDDFPEDGGEALRADIIRVHGRMLESTGSPEQAIARLDEAMMLAGAAGDDVGAARAAIALMTTLSDEADRHAEALMLGKTARLLLRDLEPESESGPLTAALEEAYAKVLTRKRDYAAAQAQSRRSITLHERLYGADHPRTIDAVSTHTIQLVEASDPAAAIVLMQRVHDSRRQIFGEGHPLVMDALNNMGAAQTYAGNFKAAVRLHRRCHELRERALGPEHPKTLSSLTNLSESLAHVGITPLEQFDESSYEDPAAAEAALDKIVAALAKDPSLLEAERNLRRVIALSTRTRGADHPRTIAAYDTLGAVLTSQGRHEEAERVLRGALASVEAREEATALDSFAIKFSLSANLAETGRFAEAYVLIREAELALSESLDPEHPNLVETRALRREIEELGQLTPEGVPKPKPKPAPKSATTPPTP